MASTAAYPIDLHVHSTASDGALSPAELVRLAGGRGVEVLALTDHDTMAGCEAAAAAAAELGMLLVGGVELSAWHQAEVHILGYFLDPEAPALVAAIGRRTEARVRRVHEICRQLEAAGAAIDPEVVLGQAAGNVGRPHVARALIAAGHVGTLHEAFARFLGPEGAAYVPASRLSAREAIALIHQSGGLAVLAHPGADGGGERLDALAAERLDGVEVFHPGHGPEQRAHLWSRARALGLCITGGSDFHDAGGKARPGAVGMNRPLFEALLARHRASRVPRRQSA